MMAGDKIFQALNLEEPRFYRYMKERRTMSFIFIFILGNQISNYFWSTGAFEVFYKGNLVFSKLKSGRMPYIDEILEGIMKFKGK